MLVAPMTWEPDGAGTIAVIGRDGDGLFGDRELRLIRGVADLTSLALGNARRMSELERSTSSWRDWTRPSGKRRSPVWSSPSSPARCRTCSAATRTWPGRDRTWGSHIDARDREDATRALLRAIESGVGEVGVSRPERSRLPRCIRDLVHVIRGRGGAPTILRGLMVDITERKRAERALAASERKYSDAFKREREAAQRLRMLDDMKNTFLEAVSHDLRTPLTSILGSALTLERSSSTSGGRPRHGGKDRGEREEAGTAAVRPARPRRLQRGIVSPKRRATDLEGFVKRAVKEMDTRAPDRARRAGGERSDRSSEDGADPREPAVEQHPTHPRGSQDLGPRAAARRRRAVRRRGRRSGRAPELREAVFEPFRQAPGVLVGARPGGRHRPVPGAALRRAPRGQRLGRGREGGGASFHVFLPGS